MNFLLNGDEPGRTTILLAHGAGAAMDTPWMTTTADALANRGFRVARFEFSYMAARRIGGSRRPPARAETYTPEYLAAIDALASDAPLLIGGKSMGGRVASLIAQDLYDAGRITGLVCLGFPFHVPKKPGTTRFDHLAKLNCPTLICQGTRDPFGTREEVANYPLSPSVEMFWLEDGDHDLKPRKRLTGKGLDDHLLTVAEQISCWNAAQE
ncbi:alpha/beta family hydrolase [Phaeobacter porticola]|uniref:Alpha/beta hydrolase family protein n=1 Tax=Phaeobacter porticola TaxID=1844006 RepID=A0A1L3I6Z7_9RHOB|nr:alpha/beta family hydrolase [Phaeobacter porticola]APG47929.1 Alpha/beta hydrolase family protein [Phaeobacter porticola]